MAVVADLEGVVHLLLAEARGLHDLLDRGRVAQRVAEILAYQDDNQVHMQPAKARALYLYLLELYRIVAAGLRGTEGAYGNLEVKTASFSIVDGEGLDAV